MLSKFLAISSLFVGLNCFACNVSFNSASDLVKEVVMSNGWGFKNYAQICAKLQRANAALIIDGDATVLSNRSVAWASVSLKDMDTMIFSNSWGGVTTKVNDFASMDLAKKMLIEAVNDAVNSVKIDAAIEGLNQSRKQARSVIRAQ